MTEPWKSQDGDSEVPLLKSPERSQDQSKRDFTLPSQRYPKRPSRRKGVILKIDRPWYQKKRFIVPAVAVCFFVLGGAVNNADKVGAILASASSGTTAPVTKSPTLPSPLPTKASTTYTPPPVSAAPAPPATHTPVQEPPAPVVEPAPAPVYTPKQEPMPEAAPAPAPEPKVAPAPPAPEPVKVTAKDNALRTAEEYLSISPFSRTGLIKQLVFEKYSTADATWAVDNVTVDWNAQAAKSATDYLKLTSFSRSGLIDQLVFEGFTPDQAAYGVSKTGL